MVAYQPPKNVQLMIGACHRSTPLIKAAQRIADLAAEHRSVHIKLGLEEDFDEEMQELAEDLAKNIKNAHVRKNDTPLQMTQVAEIMANAKEWLSDFRALAIIELSLDTPSLRRAFSSAPEINDGYPRDLLDELELRLKAASDLRARLEDIGFTDRVIAHGKRLAGQLKTAIGKSDLQAENLNRPLVSHYMKKARLHALLKRVTRTGKYAFRKDRDVADEYHLNELETPKPTQTQMGTKLL